MPGFQNVTKVKKCPLVKIQCNLTMLELKIKKLKIQSSMQSHSVGTPAGEAARAPAAVQGNRSASC